MEKKRVGKKIRKLREERGLSLREIANLAEISPANLSNIENGKVSPTLTSLRKILEVLGTSFGEFFGEDRKPMESPVFHSKEMKSIKNTYRKYTFLLPKRKEIKFQLVLEEIKPHETPEMEVHHFDIGGFLLEGGPLELEIEGEKKWEINPGDAFYVPSGYKHYAVNKGKKAYLLTVYYPPRY